MTENCKRLSYARICIEGDIDAPFTYYFDFQTAEGKVVDIKVKYLWKPLRCATCKVFGHSSCSPGNAPSVNEKGPTVHKQVWVAKPPSGTSSPKIGVESVVGVSQNIFSVLENVDNGTAVAEGQRIVGEDNSKPSSAFGDGETLAECSGTEDIPVMVPARGKDPVDVSSSEHACVGQEGDSGSVVIEHSNSSGTTYLVSGAGDDCMPSEAEFEEGMQSGILPQVLVVSKKKGRATGVNV